MSAGRQTGGRMYWSWETEVLDILGKIPGGCESSAGQSGLDAGPLIHSVKSAGDAPRWVGTGQ